MSCTRRPAGPRRLPGRPRGHRPAAGGGGVGRGGRQPRPRHHRGAQRLGAARVRERARGLQRLLPRRPRLHGGVGASDDRPSRGIYDESRDGRPRVSRLRRRQPLLRGGRCLHPAPRPQARAPHHPVGRDQRAQVPRDRRPREPCGGERHVRPDRQGRRAVRLLPRQPRRQEPARDAARARAHPARVPRPRRPPRHHGRARPRVGVAVPDARDDLRGAPRPRPRGCRHHVPRLQPLARRGLGLRLPGPHLRRALHLARRPRRRRRGAGVGARPGRPHGRHAPGRPTHALRPPPAGRPDVRPVLGPGERGRHHRRRPRG